MENTAASQFLALLVAGINLLIMIVSKLPPLKNKPAWKWVFRVTLIILILVAAAYVYLLTRPAVRITDPQEKAEVAIEEMVKGTSKNIPASREIWLVLYSHPVRRYYPQDRPAEMETTGNWASPCTIGIRENTGVKFDILAVLTDARLGQVFRNYHSESAKNANWPGMEKLPEAAKIHHRITVIRK